MNVSVAEATRIITYVRAQPLGPFVGSTPAFMDPPSIDPPPDPEYPGFIDDNKDRRTLIWVGGNDGMMHAIDARTGIEVYAFIPFNLLAKLKALPDGNAIGSPDFFVDSSPKLADVRIGTAVATCAGSALTCWRTYLFFGEGPGGTFYQALDVTLDDMGVGGGSGDGHDDASAGVLRRRQQGEVPLVVPALQRLRLHAGAVRRHQVDGLERGEVGRRNVVRPGRRPDCRTRAASTRC